jgi:LemA protein
MGYVILAVLAAIAVIVVVYGILIYNGLIRLRRNIDQAFSNIDVLLKQRHDELPKLVKACERYMTHEQETLRQVIEARNQFGGSSRQVEAMSSADMQIERALKGLFAVIERYPELKADRSFAQLQQRITGLENAIADRREFYNHTVTIFNTRIEQFPEVLVARKCNYQPQPLWKIDPEHRRDPGIAWA